MDKMKYFGALGLLLAACGGQASGGVSEQDQSALKKAAAESVANGTASGDACAKNGWYGDKVCDTFCADHDTDCVPSNDKATVCAEFVEAPNGICSRKPDDPCIFQDPDCKQGTPPNAGSGAVVCATLSEVSDGKCGRPESDVCRWQDPDCQLGFACPAIEEAPDGKCSRPATDQCQSIDPDCASGGPTPGSDVDGGAAGSSTDGGGSAGDSGGSSSGGGVACAEYVMQSDGKCSLPPDDPCLFHDPDCSPSK